METNDNATRLKHSHDVLTRHDAGNLEAAELSCGRYALVEHHERNECVYVTPHDSRQDALAYAGEEMADGWLPTQLINLDTGEVIADYARDEFSWRTIVTLGTDDQRRVAAEREIAELRRAFRFDPEGGLDADGNDLSSNDALLDYALALEDRLLGLLTQVGPGLATEGE